MSLDPTLPLGRPSCGAWLAGSVRQDAAHNRVVLDLTGPMPTREFVHPEGVVIVAGDCIASDAALRAATALFLRGWTLSLLRLPGAFLAIARTRNDVSIYPSHLVHGFYRHASATAFTFSTDARLLGSEINPNWVLRQFALATHPEFVEYDSPYVGVMHIPFGHALRYTASGEPSQCIEIFQPSPDQFSPISRARAVIELREALVDSVSRRILHSSPVTADFSGGLDSSSLALVASELADYPIHTITVSSAHQEANVDSEHARELLRGHGNIEGRIFQPAELPPRFANVDDAPDTDEPYFGLSDHAKTIASYRYVASVGSASHMSGHAGDGLFGAPAARLLSFLLRGRLIEAARFARLLSSRRRTSATMLLYEAASSGLSGGYEYARQRAAKWLRAPELRDAAWTRTDGWLLLPPSVRFLSSDAREVLADILEDLSGPLSPHPLGSTPSEHRFVADLMGLARACRPQLRVAQSVGVNLQAPFFDSAVVAIVRSVSMSDRFDEGRPKPLLADALTPLVGPEVFRRTTKGDYTADFFDGLVQHRDILKGLLLGGWVSESGLFQRDLLEKEIVAATSGMHGVAPLLSDLIGMETWARNVLSSVPAVST